MIGLHGTALASSDYAEPPLLQAALHQDSAHPCDTLLSELPLPTDVASVSLSFAGHVEVLFT